MTLKVWLYRAAAVLLFMCLATLPTNALAEGAETGQVTAEDVKLRQAPDTESQILAELARGTEVEVLATEGNWHRVLYNDQVGYIRSDYLFLKSAGSCGAYVIDDNTALRGGPGDSAYVVAALGAGRGVKVKTIIGEWYFVHVDELSGYVKSSELLITASSTASASMLKKGMEGEEVKRLQKELSRRGFLSNADVSGVFDSKTREGVLAYQKAAGLSSADGVAGPETLNSVYDSSNNIMKENATYNRIKGTVVLLDWFKGGSDWLEKGARFTVTDVRTGLSFRVRRFGGWYHADCEPITASDTAIMKRAAGGKWSWDRRPIWVTYNGKTVAASMHCMPHMVDPTASNNFDGHFCIHLYNSLVHETSRECPRHQACVMEAYRAGRAD